MQCVPDNCGTLTENQYLMDADDEFDDRCVEYDGVPPSHCAIVTLDMKLIYETNPPMLIGDCAIIDCANGNPTSTECSNPWVRPDIGWGLEARSN